MKKLIVTSLATLACVAAFAQGKVSFVNDGQHLVYYDPSLVLPQDAALAGQGVSSAAMPSGITLVADLYTFSGTGAGTLVLTKTTSFSGVAGKWTTANITATPAPGGQADTFQVQVRDSNFATAAAAEAAGSYFGFSSIFTMSPGSGIPFNSIVNLGTPSFSTWGNGSFDASAFGGAGAHGSIDVQVVPEPATFALAGLGAAALLIFRRRK